MLGKGQGKVRDESSFPQREILEDTGKVILKHDRSGIGYLLAVIVSND